MSHAAFYLSGMPATQPQEHVVVDVLRRLLTRGDRPPVDPSIESWVLQVSGLAGQYVPSRDPGDLSVRPGPDVRPPSRDSVARALRWRLPFEMDPVARAVNGDPLIDSDIEQAFLQRVIGGAAASVGQWMVPQAGLGPLIGLQQDQRRVDFLMSHPTIPLHVFELDGAQHRAAEAVDRDRDASLASVQIGVTRLTRQAVGESAGERLAPWAAVAVDEAPSDEILRLVWAPAVAHRVSRAIVEGLATGALDSPAWRIRVEEPTGVAAIAVQATLEVLAAVADVWGSEIAPHHVTLEAAGQALGFRRTATASYVDDAAVMDVPVSLSVIVEPFLGPWHRLPVSDGIPTIVVRSACLPIDLREGRLEGGRRRVVSDPVRIDRASLERLLRSIFAKREFYPSEGVHPRGQEVAIRRLLGGRDSVVLLPTGAGKSLIYQFAGLMLPGRTLVIDPLVALIDDQLDGLARQGIDRGVGITSADTAAGRTEAKLAAIQAGDAYFCYVAPERLQQRAFRDAVRALSVASPINICVVDEAHCVSEWGHDFRTSYLDLGRVLRGVASDVRGVAPPLLALTGTASRSVLRDLMIELDLDRSDPETIIAPKDFDRPELQFDIVRGREDETTTRLIGTLRSLPSLFGVPESNFFSPDGPDSYCGVVFTQTVNPSKAIPDGGVMKLQHLIERETGAPVGIYSGGKPKAWTGGSWDEAKRRFAASFKDNNLTVLVSTKAYGMGIDKPNIRYIVHVGVPGSIEAYYQEAGRAGRDRQRAHCVIVHDRGGRGFHDFIQEKSYRGPEADVEDVQWLVSTIGEIGLGRQVSVPQPYGDDAAENVERAIHRLKLLGVIEDYLVDFGGRRFDLLLAYATVQSVDDRLLDFVRRTLPGRVPQFEAILSANNEPDLALRVRSNASLLISFVYETVVNARKRALEEMVRLAEEAQEDDEIRSRILRYLELGRVAGELEALVDLSPFTFTDWQAVYQQLDTVDDAREWRGATARFLESAPDHPGLLAGRALAEAVVPGGDLRTFVASVKEAMQNASEKYLLDDDGLASFAEWLVLWVHQRHRSWAAITIIAVERALGDTHLARLEQVERQILQDRRSTDPDELGVVLARRLDRDRDLIHLLADQARTLR